MRIGTALAGILLIALIAGAPVASAQTSGPSVRLVSLDASTFPILTLHLSVIDSTGRPIAGITPASIEVLEDGSPAEIVSVRDVSDDSQAIAVVIVIDTSDSMAGEPLAAAKRSAITFVNGLGPDDQVAVLAFGSTVREVHPFTADKTGAQAAIEQLATSGTTALYDAANQGVLSAARSSLPRRVLILLGDGAEYGGASLSRPEDAYQAARVNGVTIHTIALGFSADTSYFRQLSGLTGGVALEAPTPAELDAQWKDISSLMRQLVEVVVRSKVPGDGQTHGLAVRVTTGGGQAEVTGTFKSSAVVPKVTIIGLDSATPIREVTAVTASVEAQGRVTGVTFVLDGAAIAHDPASPWATEIDPLTLTAGGHRLVVEAADESGTTGSKEISFQVAALPPRVSLSLSEGQTLDAPLSITPEVASQSESNTVTVAVDGKAVETLTVPPYRFTIDPARLSSGAHILLVTVKDSDGKSASAEVGFNVVKPATAGASLIWIVAGAAVVVVAIVAGALLLRRGPAAAPAAITGLRLEVLTGTDRGKAFAVTDEKQLIGRLSTAPMALTDPTGVLHLSREHARVWKSGAAAYIEDAGSRYGTVVNGQKISGPTPLVDGAKIRLGEVELVFHGPAHTAGDLRATRFDLGTAAPPAPRPDKTMVIEPKADAERTPRTVDGQSLLDVDEKARSTRLKSESRATPGAGSAESPPSAGDEEELRRTRLKPEAEDENRQTRVKPPD